jgi:hypothetical protein
LLAGEQLLRDIHHQQLDAAPEAAACCTFLPALAQPAGLPPCLFCSLGGNQLHVADAAAIQPLTKLMPLRIVLYLLAALVIHIDSYSYRIGCHLLLRNLAAIAATAATLASWPFLFITQATAHVCACSSF